MIRRSLVAALLACAAAVASSGIADLARIPQLRLHETALIAFIGLMAVGIFFKARTQAFAAAAGLIGVATPAALMFDGPALYVYVLFFAAMYAVSAAGCLRVRRQVTWKGFGGHATLYLAASLLTLTAIDRFGTMYEIVAGAWLSGLAAVLHLKPPPRSK
jgi:hypothetical protein